MCMHLHAIKMHTMTYSRQILHVVKDRLMHTIGATMQMLFGKLKASKRYQLFEPVNACTAYNVNDETVSSKDTIA